MKIQELDNVQGGHPAHFLELEGTGNSDPVFINSSFARPVTVQLSLKPVDADTPATLVAHMDYTLNSRYKVEAADTADEITWHKFSGGDVTPAKLEASASLDTPVIFIRVVVTKAGTGTWLLEVLT